MRCPSDSSAEEVNDGRNGKLVAESFVTLRKCSIRARFLCQRMTICVSNTAILAFPSTTIDADVVAAATVQVVVVIVPRSVWPNLALLAH